MGYSRGGGVYDLKKQQCGAKGVEDGRLLPLDSQGDIHSGREKDGTTDGLLISPCCGRVWSMGMGGADIFGARCSLTEGDLCWLVRVLERSRYCAVWR